MSSYAPQAIYAMYEIVRPHISSMEESGIVGNSAHTYGYHCARNDLLRDGHYDDYSISTDPRDKLGDGTAASAIDMKLSPSDMITVSKRLISLSQAHDPRLVALREFFGTVDGRNTTGYSPYRNSYESTGDMSHLWHIHLSIVREFSNDFAACAGIAQALAGVPLHSTPAPTPAPTAGITIAGKQYPAIDVLHVVQTVQAQHGGYTSRNTYYVQTWLHTVGRYNAAIDGQWGPVTQAAFDGYRSSLGWGTADASGDAGLSSLTHLHDAAHGTIPVQP